MKRLALTTVIVAAAAVLSGCGKDDTTTATSDSTAATTVAPATTAASSDESATAASASGGSSLAFADSSLGKILVDGKGMTLYLFMPDSATKSACNGGCAAAWPPVAGPATGKGVDAGDLGTVTRDDGTVQATFYGHPLYTYAEDTKPGDVTGQGSAGKWYVIDADGSAVGADAAKATTTTASASGY